MDVHCLGAYESRTVLYFSEDGNENSVISECGTVEIQVDTIDNLTKDEPVTYIKMDIEGAELAALKGASDTIRKYRPRLAICVYHNREDLLRIPDYILSLNSDYKLYLRSYEKFGVDTVMYAI